MSSASFPHRSLLLLLLATASCTEESGDYQKRDSDLQEISFSTSSEAGLKTGLSGNYGIVWNEGDRLSIYDGRGNRLFSTCESGKEAVFSGVAVKTGSYTALYPYDETAVFTGNGISSSIPLSQKAVAGGFDPQASLMAATAESPALKMKHACGVLRLNVSRSGIAGIRILTNGGEALSGRTEISFSDGLPCCTASDPEVRLLPDGNEIAPGTYSLFVAPGAISKGLTIEFTDSSGMTASISSNKPLNVSRARVTPLQFDDSDLKFEDESEILGPATTFRPGSGANAVFVDGDRLICGGSGGAWFYDISEPLNPVLKSSVPLAGMVRQITVAGDYAYLACRETGLWVIDMSDFQNPTVAKHFDSIELATGIDAAGDALFIGTRSYGVEFVDISDRKRPEHVRLVSTNESQSVFYQDGYLYSGEWGVGKVTIIDAHDLSDIRKLGTVSLDGYGDGVFADGDRLYVCTGHNHKISASSVEGDGHGMEIWDISNPASPVRKSRVEFGIFYSSGNDFWYPKPSGDGRTVFCADTGNGLYVVDVHDWNRPAILAHYDPGYVLSAAVGDGAVYMACGSGGGFKLAASSRARKYVRNPGRLPVNVSSRDPYDTPSGSSFNVWRPSGRVQVHAVAPAGDRLYAACGEGGLAVLELDEDNVLQCKGYVEGIPYAHDVKVRKGLVYVARGTEGLGVYRITGLVPTEVASLPRVAEDDAHNLCVWVNVPNDNYVVVGCRYAGYLFYDASRVNEGVLTLRGTSYSSEFGGSMTGWNRYICDEVCEGGLYPLYIKSGILWFDLSNPAKLTLSSRTPVSGKQFKATSCNGICRFKNGSALFVENEALRQISAGGTSVTDEYEFGYRGNPKWDEGNRVVIASYINKKVQMVNVADFPRSCPNILKEVIVGNPDIPVFWNELLVVPGGYQGVLVEK